MEGSGGSSASTPCTRRRAAAVVRASMKLCSMPCVANTRLKVKPMAVSIVPVGSRPRLTR